MMLAGTDPGLRRKRVQAILESLGLEDRAHHRPDQLSGGQRQRVAIARATVMKPTLLLADEPTGNLDPANKERTLEALLRACDRTDATLVAVTHDHDLVPRFGRVIDFKTLGAAVS